MEISRDFFNLLKQFKKLRFAIEVSTISGGVLGNKNNFVNTLLNEMVNFVKKVRKRKRNLFSSDMGNNAKRAGIITAFSNFEIFKSLVKIGQCSRRIKSLKVRKNLRFKALKDLGKSNSFEVVSGEKGKVGIGKN